MASFLTIRFVDKAKNRGRESSSLVPLKQIPRVDLNRHVCKLVAPAVGHDHVTASHEDPQVVRGLGSEKLRRVQRGLVDHQSTPLAFTRISPEHWCRIRTNNGIERINREVRMRMRVVGTFPDGNSALMLVTALLKNLVVTEWCKRRYLDMSKLEKMDGRKERRRARKERNL